MSADRRCERLRNTLLRLAARARVDRDLYRLEQGKPYAVFADKLTAKSHADYFEGLAVAYARAAGLVTRASNPSEPQDIVDSKQQPTANSAQPVLTHPCG